MATLLRVQPGTDPVGNDPEHPTVKISGDKSKIEGYLDVRDILSHAVANNHQNMNDPTIKANFQMLANRVGLPTAQKLMTKVFLFNQNNKGAKGVDRLQAFYDQTQNDEPEIGEILKQVKGIGYGVRQGYANSHLFATPDDDPAGTAFVAKKPMLRVSK